MKKLIYLLFLLPFYLLAQNPTSFPYGVKITGGQPTNSTPVYFTCTELNGLQTKIASALIEKTANKSNDLTTWDGTGAQYIGKDGFNAFATKFAQVSTKTGLLSKADTFNLIPLTNSTLRISPVESAMFWDELFVMNTTASSAIKSFPQKDYVLTELVTATGGNVNTNPITTDGKHVRYLAYDKNGNVYSSASNFISNNTLLQLGFVTVLKTGATVEFIDGTAGPRNVLAQPALASNTAFDKVASTITNVSVGRKSNASFSTSNGTITGISVNWKSAANPTNSDPIDVFNYTGQATAAFVAIDPTFLTSTSAITTHTLLTELDGGIPVNESFYNTTTGLRGTMANGSAGVARIMVGVRGGIFWQMGEFATTACYADLATAKSNIYSHVFSDAIVPPGVAYEIARVAFTKGVTVTNNDTQFYLVNTGGGSGGSSTIPPVSDATTATKGIVKLAGDLGGTADLPTTPTAVHLTGPETISGVKTYLDGTIGHRNVANTFTSFFKNTNTASRTYTLQDINGTIAHVTNPSDMTINGVRVGKGAGNIVSNTVVGNNSLVSITTGSSNTAVGQSSLTNLTTGVQNIAIGNSTLTNLTTGVNNTAIGIASLLNLVATNEATAIGANAGRFIADGVTSLTASTNGLFVGSDTKASANGNTNEIVIGYNATGNGSNSVTLGNSSITKTILQGNVGIGVPSPTKKLEVSGDIVVNSNITVGRGGGSVLGNTAVGLASLLSNTSAVGNSGFGSSTLTSATTGGNNTAVGQSSLANITTGSSNIAVGGLDAGSYLTDGTTPNQTSNNSIFIGSGTKASAAGLTNEIVIGNSAVGNGSNTLTLGHTTITNTYIRGVVNASSFKTTTGTAFQTLMANGTVSTGYRHYRATIDQLASNAPTISEKENTLGVTVTAARTGTGTYTLTASGAIFQAGFTLTQFTNQNASVNHVCTIERLGTAQYSIKTYNSGALSDDILKEASLEIKVKQ